ncbi:DNA-binding Lrp family transcriptional regulator [Desulfohalotomaculum tongense]|uniref:siroheme decarboxylase subunit beta n=1 Tax=Desulforadius tongensis TaxID=1216062 RepID=UPI00195B6E49|nr:Lrp/AsnC family transcriptional regulator [Desulforadius tongensis]MBM7855569.1 DNA-binding Lrp family transcriptional regulator [Desulforadius tongensis]
MLTELEKNIIKALQAGLPLVSRPFAQLGLQFGLAEEEMLNKVNELKQKGYLRRIGAALRHQRVGYVANAMVVWRVPEDRAKEVGEKLAQHPEVTHCYQRKTGKHWPYNLYTMIHKQTREECKALAEEMARSVGVADYRLLFSTRELKKSSMTYFAD